METIKKTHLIFGLLETVCGRDLEIVKNTFNRNECTCKSCKKYTTENYPNK